MTRNIKLPPRVQQIIIDSDTGKYPMLRRMALDDRTGIASSTFDDTSVVVFSASLISYPTALPSGSQYIDSQTVTGLTSSLLIVSGTVTKGVVDDLLALPRTSSIQPYDETRNMSFIVGDDPFHATGSSIEEVGMGFSSPLRSKSMIIVDLEPRVENTFTDRTVEDESPGLGDTGSGSYPMQYFNHTTKQWEGVFRGLPKRVQYGVSLRPNLANLAIGFGPSGDHIIGAAQSGYDALKSAGLPMDLFGFPFDARYHASSSQLFPLKDKITGPFLLEKIVYEFSGTLFSTGNFGESSSRIGISSFFILNQRGPARIVNSRLYTDPITSTIYEVTSTVPQTLPLVTGTNAATTFVNTTRDLVTFAQVSAFNRDRTQANAISGSLRELNISGANVETAGRQVWTGNFILSGTCKSPTRNDGASVVFLETDLTGANYAILYARNNPGGRTGRGEQSGRSLKSDVAGSVRPTGSYGLGSIPLDVYASQSITNPYVLLPTDNLIFGWQTPVLIAEYRDPGYGLRIHSGSGRCILYGSLMQENHEFHDSLNQNLTSLAVHEDLHRNNPILDQYDTEPRNFFSGSFLSEYITGSMTLEFLKRRRVLASNLVSASVDNLFNDTMYGAENRARLTGFNRFMQYTSANERYFDTLMPRYDKISIRDGSPILTRFAGSTPTHNIAVLGTFMTSSGGTVYPNIAPNIAWLRAFPFEPRYSDIPRDQDVIVNTEGTRKLATGIFGDALKAPEFKKLTLAYTIIHSQSLSPVFPIIYLIDADESIASPREVMLHLYGVGDHSIGCPVDIEDSSTPTGQRRVSGTVGNAVHWQSRSLSPFTIDFMVGSIFKGFKYGVHNALPQYSRAVFRRNSFGQFRDILEQRLDGKFFDTVGVNPDGSISGRQSATSSPVQVKFVVPSTTRVTSPTKTFSSNLSNEATASMPYFDDKVKNREEPLNLSNINSSIVTI